MLETLGRETLNTAHVPTLGVAPAASDEGTTVRGNGQHRVVVRRSWAAQPALRRPSSPPPSERRTARSTHGHAHAHAYGQDLRPESAPSVDAAPSGLSEGRLRLTRRGRLAVLVTVVFLLLVAFSVGRVMGNAASGPAKAATHTVVVAPGDTAWSIARVAMPHLDGRDAVDRLLALNHSDGRLQVGQTLVVPGS
jgi:LysM repeat protein